MNTISFLSSTGCGVWERKDNTMTEEAQSIRSLSDEELEELIILRFRAQEHEERRIQILRDSRVT
ncbi:hypothetical protein N7537_011858 [Penicillium hordei]|uniref:Uncharacterized protein n=1 Tax=Penicillium hordei TaxID=40994 RepID=A0AAD6DN84_9EURO|nr:uncharacterized protein N7537_011858 [Penicillium hordei]KAJ5589180.1 hypothetical protein N7537_011858 [Penicillium hordei]